MVHDVPRPGPYEQDFWLYDLTWEATQHIAARDFGIADPRHRRLVVPLVWRAWRFVFPTLDEQERLRRSQQPPNESYNVLFVVQTGTDSTYLSEKTMKTLSPDREGTGGSMPVEIEGVRVHCYPSHGHFADVNVLGMNALEELGWSAVLINWAGKTFTLMRWRSSAGRRCSSTGRARPSH
ncbi:unnamed protein product [Vitrella brassicaformis CCMP3155]|uniref:Uncharacterized protein n=1 Tax=Vitrella brassicaformis (strain CCMP3155) TaxID=1169540 RepID=A0A0G4G152_VITBC|nr:unnamed protein product [Vitrella brassicaformis CCMP3155]|eukprot:CEM21718.1 unnamed protein product [Vitrella brassicaformis CCMP3155]